MGTGHNKNFGRLVALVETNFLTVDKMIWALAVGVFKILIVKDIIPMVIGIIKKLWLRDMRIFGCYA
jgi:hypothetical protein